MNNLELVARVVKGLLPGDVIQMSCPEVVDEQSVAHWEGGYLFVLPALELLFLVQDGPGRKRNLVANVLGQLKHRAAYILVGNNSQLTLVSRIGDATMELKDITSQTLYRTINVVPRHDPISESNEQISSPDIPFRLQAKPPAFLVNTSPEDAPLLANYVKRLGEALSRQTQDEAKNQLGAWRAAAFAAQKILPQAVQDKRYAFPAIEALARSIIFLPPGEQLNAIRGILRLSTSQEVTPDISEMLAGVALGVAPSMDVNALSIIMSDLVGALHGRGALPPSLAQLISFLRSRVRR